MNQRLVSVEQLDFHPVGTVNPSPKDWRDQVIYHVLIDRFDDNREYPAYVPGSPRCQMDEEQGRLCQGGNLKGITRRLDYIKNLGCTTVWLSPPFKNRQECNYQFHGYGIQDFLSIDPRFGTLEELQALVHEARARGMYVVLDVIINHTGDNWAYENDGRPAYSETGRHNFGFWRTRERKPLPHDQINSAAPDDAVWPKEFQDPDFYKRRGRIRDFIGASREEKINADFEDLKELDLQNPKVLDALVRCYKYWIAATDVDGFRLDAIGHTEPYATAAFTNAIREYAISIGKDNFMLFAEIVAEDRELLKYVGQNTPNADTSERYPRFDAVLDFPLYFSLEEVIKGTKSPSELHDRLERLGHTYRDFSRVGRYFVTFVDNHDQFYRPFKRFMHGVDDPKLSTLAVGYVLLSMGIPCIYYGTEQGFDGGGATDSYVRECMFGGKWGAFGSQGCHHFNSEHPIYQSIARIAHIRAENRTIRYGRQYVRPISGNSRDFGLPQVAGKCTFAFSKVLDVDEILIAMNLDQQPREDCLIVDEKLSPPGTHLKDIYSCDRTLTVEQSDTGIAFVRVPLEGHGLAILKRVEQ